MERVKGKDAYIKIYDAAASAYVPFLCSRSCNLELGTSMLQITDATDGEFYNGLPQMISGTMSGDGLARIDKSLYSFDGYSTVGIAALVLAKTKVQVQFYIKNTESSPSSKTISAYGYFESLKLTGANGDEATYSYQIKLVGTIVYA